MPPEVRAESRAKQGELAITSHNDQSHQALKSFTTRAFSFNRNESRNGRFLHGMQGVSGSNPLGSIFKNPGPFFSASLTAMAGVFVTLSV